MSSAAKRWRRPEIEAIRNWADASTLPLEQTLRITKSLHDYRTRCKLPCKSCSLREHIFDLSKSLGFFIIIIFSYSNYFLL